MAQQAQFKKLKEQIEAAKRGLTEMSDAEIDHGRQNLTSTGPSHGFSPSASENIIEPKQIQTNPVDKSLNDAINTEREERVSEDVLIEMPIVDDTTGNTKNVMAEEFQFFHRRTRPKGADDFVKGISSKEDNHVENEALLIEQLGLRLAKIENGVEQNRKFILELINLLSKLELRQKPASRKLKPSQRLNRRHIFWLLIGLLVLGWFGLTPSGHIAFEHFLTLI